MSNPNDDFSKVPTAKASTVRCFSYPKLFGKQNPLPVIESTNSMDAYNNCDKSILVELMLRGTNFRLREVLKVQRTSQVNTQQRYRVVLTTLENVMIEAIIVLNRFGELQLESKYQYRLTEI